MTKPDDMTDTQTKLLACPFCGGAARLYIDWVTCESEDCGNQTPGYRSGEEAIAAWNRRAPQGQWQDISTAPRIDYAPIDLWVEHSEQGGRRCPNACWDGRCWTNSGGNYLDWTDGDRWSRVTHWMPLPAPPKDSADAD